MYVMEEVTKEKIIKRMEEIDKERNSIMYNHNKNMAVSQKEYDVSTDLLMKEYWFLSSLIEKDNQSETE